MMAMLSLIFTNGTEERFGRSKKWYGGNIIFLEYSHSILFKDHKQENE